MRPSHRYLINQRIPEVKELERSLRYLLTMRASSLTNAEQEQLGNILDAAVILVNELNYFERQQEDKE